MPTIELNGTTCAVDENGCLEDPTIRNDRVAAGLPKPTGRVWEDGR